jgi:outer membrane lipoprotein carrier protein
MANEKFWRLRQLRIENLMNAVMRSALAAAFCLFAAALHADEPTAAELLAAALSSQERLEGKFEQIHNDPQGRELERSSGHFKMLRPGYLRWEVAAPEPQLLISDLDYLWHYDIDLETATRRRLDDTVRLSPGQLLSGDPQALNQLYDIVKVTTTTGDEHYILRPRSELRAEAGFASLELTLDGQFVREMRVHTSAGATTDIHFSDLLTTSQVDISDFVFTPPPGTDIFYHD